MKHPVLYRYFYITIRSLGNKYLLCIVQLCLKRCENNNSILIKGKAVPLQARRGPEGSRKLRFPDFVTTVQDSGKFSLTHRPPLPPGNTPGTHFC